MAHTIHALGLGLILASAACALVPDDCTFYAPFDGSFDASQAAGSPAAAVKSTISFVPGIRGQGILVGAPDTGLSYLTAGNLSLDSGTVSVWVKPETWDDTDAAMRFFFSLTEAAPRAEDGGTFVWLYRYFSRSTYWLVWDSRAYPTVSGQIAFEYDKPDVFRKGVWVHLAGTWNGDEIRLYIDGKPQSTARVPTPRILRSLNDRFTVGDANRANAADTVLDELRIFRRALTPPEIAALHQHQLTAEPAQQELSVATLPGRRRVKVEVNAIAHTPRDVAGLTAEIRLASLNADKAIQPPRQATIRFTASQHAGTEFDTADLPVGDYRVTSTLNENGKPLATGEAGFTLAPTPRWLGSRVGIVEGVPAPWTPLEVTRRGDAATVGCWGPRRYEVSGALLPTRMSIPTGDILAAPVSLTGLVDGRPLQVAQTQTAWGKQGPARAELTVTGAGGEVTVTAHSFIEYDGLLWTTLALRGRGPVQVGRLTLEIPLLPAAATLMTTGFGWDQAGAVRPWSHRVLANAQVWLGNEDGGLQCTIPSAKNWRNADRNRQIELVPGPDRVTLRLNLVDKESTFAEGAEYAFGLQLTPVRPAPEGWRKWRITPPDEVPGTRFNPFYTEGWAVGTSYPTPKPEFKSMFQKQAEKGDIPVLYLQPTCTWAGMPEYPTFAAEWHTKAGQPPPPADPKASPTSSFWACPRAASWADWFVTTFCDTLQGPQKDLPWGGVYLDCAMLSACDNPDHGCGYRDEYGVRQPEQPYLEHRDVQRRLFLAIRERWPEKLVFNHQSGQLNLMQLAFSDGLVDGEHLTDMLPTHDFSYAGILTLDRMRAEYMGRNLGFVPIFLPEFTRAGAGNAKVTAHFLLEPEPPEVLHLVGLLFLHDVVPWPAYSSDAAYNQLWAVQDAFGWDEQTELLPYWKNQDVVTLSPADPNVVCSLYRRPGKILAVVMNNTDEDREVTVQLDLQKLGLDPAVEARDAWAAASYHYTAWEADPKGGDPKRAAERVAVAGKDVRVALAAGRMVMQVAKRGFRVIAVP
ncbi:MAG: LamG domain-containing protein [Armatimonadetes bacterium]|nr:LamG domain-containing protein [Armatimonadota bacterium]